MRLSQLLLLISLMVLCKAAPQPPAIPDECTASHCNGNGVCRMLHGRKDCVCDSMHVGERCQYDRCGGCENGGSCVEDEENGFAQCRCAEGWIGKHCDREPCSESLCSGRGSCEIWQDGISHCDCQPGFEGDRCEFESCSSNEICENGGSCYRKGEFEFCACPQGFEGEYCELELCDASKYCIYGAKCRMIQHEPVCTCGNPLKIGYDCRKTPCEVNHCKNGGKCYSVNEHKFCECPTKYTGDTCEKNACGCTKHGECMVARSSSGRMVAAGCMCESLKYRGKYCEKERCGNNDYCNNNGQCFITDNRRFCECRSDHFGETCNIRTCDSSIHCSSPAVACMMIDNHPNCYDFNQLYLEFEQKHL